MSTCQIVPDCANFCWVYVVHVRFGIERENVMLLCTYYLFSLLAIILPHQAKPFPKFHHYTPTPPLSAVNSTKADVLLFKDTCNEINKV